MKNVSNPDESDVSATSLPAEKVVTETPEVTGQHLSGMPQTPQLPAELTGQPAPLNADIPTQMLTDTAIESAMFAGETLPESGNDLPPVEAPQTALELQTTQVLSSAAMTPAIATSAEIAPPVTTEALQVMDGARRTLRNETLPPNLMMAMTDTPEAMSDEALSTLPTTNQLAGNMLDSESMNMTAMQQRLAAIQMMAASESMPTGQMNGQVNMTGGAEIVSADFSAVANLAATPLSSAADPLIELPQFQNMRPLQPLQNPEAFGANLGQRLMVMSEEGLQSARIRLHPESMGALDVKIQIEDDTARVWFNAQSSQAREALESALPRLKDMLAQEGLQLLQADVGSGQDQQQSAAKLFDGVDPSFGRADADSAAMTDEVDGVPPVSVGYISQQTLDIYV